MLFKRKLNRGLGDDFTSILITITDRYGLTHVQITALRERLITAYQSQQTYDRNRKMWLVREHEQPVTLDMLAAAVRRLLDEGSTLEDVQGMTDEGLLREARDSNRV